MSPSIFIMLVVSSSVTWHAYATDAVTLTTDKYLQEADNVASVAAVIRKQLKAQRHSLCSSN